MTADKLGLNIMAQECASIAQRESVLEERIKACMRLTKNHWMITDPDARFRGAVAGAYLQSTDEEKRQIETSLKSLRALHAAISGMPVDFEQTLAETEGQELLPLLKWWHEIIEE